MEKYQQKERDFLIKDYILRVLGHWQSMLALAVIFAIAFSGFKYYKDYRAAQAAANESKEKIEAEDVADQLNALSSDEKAEVEEVIRYEETLDEREEYADNAAVMKVNAYAVNRTVLRKY